MKVHVVRRELFALFYVKRLLGGCPSRRKSKRAVPPFYFQFKMNKLYLKSLLLVSLFLLTGMEALANGTYIDGINYILNHSTMEATVTYASKYYSDGDSYSGDITIPAVIDYNGKKYQVTEIGGYAFYQCKKLTSVKIPYGVLSIGEYAFGTIGLTGGNSLTSVNIPSSVTTIGRYAFLGCSGLTSIMIPSSVTTIGIHAFRNCI